MEPREKPHRLQELQPGLLIASSLLMSHADLQCLCWSGEHEQKDPPSPPVFGCPELLCPHKPQLQLNLGVWALELCSAEGKGVPAAGPGQGTTVLLFSPPWETEVGVLAPGEICCCLPDPHPPGWPGKKPWWAYPSPALCSSQQSTIYFLFLKRFCHSSVLP